MMNTSERILKNVMTKEDIPEMKKRLEELMKEYNKRHGIDEKLLKAFSMLGYLTSVHGPDELKKMIDSIVKANEEFEKKDFIPKPVYACTQCGNGFDTPNSANMCQECIDQYNNDVKYEKEQQKKEETNKSGEDKMNTEPFSLRERLARKAIPIVA